MERRLISADHPVVRAWTKLAGPAAAPEEVLELGRTWKKRPPRPVYRLSRGTSPRFRIIAKPCQRDEVDRTTEIYRDILCHLSLRAPDVVGSVPMEGGDRVWLFVEDVEGREYRPELAAHRRLAGVCLATLHVEASRLPTPALAARPYLYDVSSAGILRHLERADTLLDEALATRPRRARNGRRILEALSRQCELLHDRWDAVRALAGTVPATLVHGDYCVSNMLIVATETGTDRAAGTRGRAVAGGGQPGPGLVVFDWQRSGWASPAFDLTRFLGSWVSPDLDAYLEIAGREWRELDQTAVLRLAYVGEILRWVEALRWELERLEQGRFEETVSLLEIYEAWMDDIRSVAPWADRGSFGERPWRSVVPYGRPPRLAPGAPVHC